ncbi:MAG: bifunctional folylpolyglutamate synthase/dihydrofolate synthase [Spirosomaceae bacterium]|jgi:dihydrofolate synthase/folylpolyglutamate synthase|nr:bifunctional folylpolyglutamate synthase/dihydrofolate synthase [Spirosomataceae bacterium]
MNYTETIAYLYARLPVFHRIGAAALKPGLQNITALCEALGNPQQQFKSIHIAGTNGKGSTSHLLAAVLQSAGYKVGLHTSPHLKSLTERFKINGQLAPESMVVDFVAQHRALIENIEPSFFEITVAMAFDYFARERVDIAVIEVGLGGRLDSTNILQPELSVITNISFDHTDLLGDTLPKIAFEKAGIIKVDTPVVVSETHPETAQVFRQKAQATNAPIDFAEDFYQVVHSQLAQGRREVTVCHTLTHSTTTYHLDLMGQYQLKNLLGVLQSVDVLRQMGHAIADEALRDGLAHCTRLTSFKGRWQVLQQNPTVVADVAHNPAGLAENVGQLAQYPYRQLHLVLGFAKDKDIVSILRLFPTDARFYFCSFDLPRAMSIEELVYISEQQNLSSSFYRDVNEALIAARLQATADDFIYVGGSTFVVAEVEEV